MRIEVDSFQGATDIYWEDEELGFGHIYLYTDSMEKVVIDSETMGKDFIKKIQKLNKVTVFT